MAARDGSVLILGCGYTGTMLAQRLAFAGKPVFGTTRSQRRASVIRTRGAQPILLDTADLSPLDRFRNRFSAIVHSVPPATDDAGRWIDPTPALVERFAGEEPDIFVYISSTSAFGDKGGAVVNELTEASPNSPRGEARLAAERAVLESGMRACVVRPAGIYGPGRSPLHRIADGRYRLMGDGAAYTNRIHVEDLVSILQHAITRGRPGALYLGSDRRPATQREVVDHVVARYGLPEPAKISEAEAKIRLGKDIFAMITDSKRLDATRTRDELGVDLRYPDYEAGFAAIWEQEGTEIRRRAAGR